MSADPPPEAARAAMLLGFDEVLARMQAVRDRLAAGLLPAPPDTLAVAAIAEDFEVAGPIWAPVDPVPTPGALDSGTPPTTAELLREAVADLQRAYHDPDARVHLICKAHRLAHRALLRLEHEGGTP